MKRMVMVVAGLGIAVAAMSCVMQPSSNKMGAYTPHPPPPPPGPGGVVAPASAR